MATSTSRGRSGMTLVELLVVIAIIGLLIGLLVPAVQSVRESARRATCRDRLRQVGLAIQSHAAAQQALPALYNGGFLPQPRSAIDEFNFHSWRAAILPLIEQTALYAQINFNLPATVAANQTAANVGVSLLVCPSATNPHRVVPDVFAWNDAAPPVARIGTAARTDFESNGGTWVARPPAGSHALDFLRFGPWGEPTYDPATGASLRYRKARLSDVTDGLSNTILIVERAGRPDTYYDGKLDPHYDPAGYDPDGVCSRQAAWELGTAYWWTANAPDWRVNFGNMYGIFAFHPGGAHVALADGSATFLKATTDPAVLNGLLTRAGSEIAAPE